MNKLLVWENVRRDNDRAYGILNEIITAEQNLKSHSNVTGY